MTQTMSTATTVELVVEPRVKTFGGWYQHTVVKVAGVEIGRIQTRRRNKRTEVSTAAAGGGCVLGMDLGWLKRQAGLEG